MRLVIADNFESDNLSDYIISLDDFADKAFHPFIASQHWDEILVQVCDTTPCGIIRQLLPIASISVIIDDWSQVSQHQLQILREVFPDYSSKLKLLYIQSKEELRKLVESINRKA